MRKNTRFDREPNRKCDQCGVMFYRFPAEMKRYKMAFCSDGCQGIWNKENVYSKLNTICSYCQKIFHRDPSKKKSYAIYFCGNFCQGRYWSENFIGDKASNWQGGKTALRIKEIQSSKYRTWRIRLLQDADCILCDSTEKLELHHVKSRKDYPDKIRDESNVVPMCEKCHDIFHSNNSKGEELRERLKAILAHGNPQPSRLNVNLKVNRKVQRPMGEEFTTNKPDTRITVERHEMARAGSKESEAENKMFCANNTEQTLITGWVLTTTS